MSGVCDDLRLGGTLTASGITGGTSINSTALAVSDWSNLLGQTGISLSPLGVSGRPGSVLAGDALGKARLLTLNMEITRWGPSNFGLTEANESLQVVANTDTFLGLLAKGSGNYMEVDMPDATKRFTQVFSIDPAGVRQKVRRNMSVPLFSEWPYWSEGGQESTDTISGADTLVMGGNVDNYSAVLVFSGDGTFTHSTLGWTITVVGSAGPVTVDCGAREVYEGGNNATNRLRHNTSRWGWFTPGNNSVTSSVSVVVTWRGQFQ